jgi:zinc protease
VLVLLAAIALAGVPSAHAMSAAPPLPAAPRPLALPPLHEITLDNGLATIVAARPGLPLVTVAIVLRAGAASDPPGRAGLAAATAALLARGAQRDGRRVGAAALAREAEALGASLDTAHGWHSVSVSMTVATPQLDAALALLADVVRRPLLAADELARWRLQALDDLDLARANPAAVAARVARRLHWGASPYGAVTTPASLWRLTRDDVVAFHRRAARPDRALLVLAGDVTPAQALALARRHLGDWRAPSRAAVAADAPRPAAPMAVREVWVDMPGAGQSGVVVAAPWAALGDADLRVAQVAAAVLGGGYSARLNQQVRIRRGLSYGVFADGEAFAGGGWWSASAQTDHATAAEVLRLIRDEVERLARDAPQPDELAARKAALVGGFARAWETTAGIAALLAGHWAADRPWGALGAYPDEIGAVTAEQVRDFAARRWPAQVLRAVVAGDLAAAGAAVPPPTEHTWRLPHTELDFDRALLVAEPP